MSPAARLDLRSGARVEWVPAPGPEMRRGKLVRPSPNGEEWLIDGDEGQRYWVAVTRLRPA